MYIFLLYLSVSINVKTVKSFRAQISCDYMADKIENFCLEKITTFSINKNPPKKNNFNNCLVRYI